MDKGVLLIVSGLSGAGKGTICKRIMEKYPDYELSISATTRGPRPGEVDGREYFFITKEEFEERIRNGQLLEYAKYVDNYYGTPKDWVLAQMEQGKNVILEIELQGAFQVRDQIPEAVLIFIMPPDMEELERRLRGRGSETEEQIKKRLLRAMEEIEYVDQYDYVIVNEEVEKSVEMLHTIVLNVKEQNKTGE
ncbi:MAG: guanylate kinase [Lachnospiraceae bacterium]|nr:guanylate kinase [Lachnospiraceae bacterium]